MNPSVSGLPSCWKIHARGYAEHRDCFAYALAKTTGEALLSKGRDFARTDIAPAIEN